MSEQASNKQTSGKCIADQLPLGGSEGLPISWQLCVIMAHVFLLFNQGLFVLMSFLKGNQGDTLLSGNFAILSLSVGGVVTAVALFAFVKSSIKQVIDWLVVLLCLGLIIAISVQNIEVLSLRSLSQCFAANCLMSIWFGRGLVALWLAKKP